MGFGLCYKKIVFEVYVSLGRGVIGEGYGVVLFFPPLPLHYQNEKMIADQKLKN
jgi:hypothetical protein